MSVLVVFRYRASPSHTQVLCQHRLCSGTEPTSITFRYCISISCIQVLCQHRPRSVTESTMFKQCLSSIHVKMLHYHQPCSGTLSAGMYATSTNCIQELHSRPVSPIAMFRYRASTTVFSNSPIQVELPPPLSRYCIGTGHVQALCQCWA